MARPSPLVAWPGDQDLVFDIDGVWISRVVRYGYHFQIYLKDGFGWWVKNGERTEFEPGAADGSGVRTSHLTFSFPTTGLVILDRIYQMLEQWREASVPLRLLHAADRHAVLMFDEECYLVLPVLT